MNPAEAGAISAVIPTKATTRSGVSPEVPLDAPIEEKMAALRANLQSLGKLIVGFSGGIDSAFLLKVAVDTLGDDAVALTAVSPSLPASEHAAAVRIAGEIGARHVLRRSDEIHNPKYAANPVNRCYFCKEALFDIAESLKQELGIEHMAIGTNVDDLGDHRPGLDAARRFGALSPLVRAGLLKSEIREVAKTLGLSIWDKPAFACLSSRFPYGTSITEGRLNRVEICEEILKSLGFKVFRVRFHGELARIEVGDREYARLLDPEVRNAISSGFKSAGFQYIALDLEAYRSGRLNEGAVPEHS